MRRYTVARGTVIASSLAAVSLVLGGCGGDEGALDGGDAAADGVASEGGGDAAGEMAPGPKDPRTCSPLPASGACADKLDSEAALPDLVLGDGWTAAKRLAAPIASAGWEDGALVDTGNVIWFGYSRADGAKAPMLNPLAPMRCMQVGDAFTIWRATPGCDNQWHLEPLDMPVNMPPVESLAPSLTADRKALFFTLGAPTGEHRIALSISTDGKTWGVPVVQSFSAPMDATGCQDDNPSAIPDGTVVVFESNRDDADASSCKGPRRLWRAARGAGGWQPPELVAKAECSFTQGNLSPSAKDLFFTVAPLGPGAGCPLAPTGGIWRVAVNGQPAPMAAAVQVVAATGTGAGIILVGDGSVDASGKRLVFSTYREVGGHADVDLAIAEKP